MPNIRLRSKLALDVDLPQPEVSVCVVAHVETYTEDAGKIRVRFRRNI